MSWVGVVGTVITTGYDAHQAGEAADAQSDAGRRAGQLSQRQFEQTRSDLQPYRVIGDQALGRISRTLGLGGGTPDMSEFQADPGYQFRLSEGNQALDRSAAGRGMLLSGAQLKSLNRYNQGMASQEFGNWYNRLSGLAGMGQNAAVQTGNFGAQNANNQGNYLMSAGNAQAQGITDQTNFITGGMGQLANLYGQRGKSGYQDTSRIGATQDAYTGDAMRNWADEQWRMSGGRP